MSTKKKLIPPYNANEAGEILNISGAGIRYIIRKYSLNDDKEIIKKTNTYLISKKGIEIIKEYSKAYKRK